ncbi:MAG: DUF6476 family protein [Pseudomonadota bacterium]|nr:DUF6476 family protein [Pseudomonadota bacterium]
MKSTKNKKIINSPDETRSLKTLKLATLVMMAIMTAGFVTIIAVLALEINAYFKKTEKLDLPENIPIWKNEKLLAITYLPKHTLIFIEKQNEVRIIRIISSETGKIFGDRLMSDLVNQESDDRSLDRKKMSDE